MKKSFSFFRLFLLSAFILLVFQNCEDAVEPNITPQAELIFEIEDAGGTPIEGATVYLFPFQSQYNDYKSAKQDALSNADPNTSADNVGTSDTNGRVFFPARDLQGNGFASGSSWVYRPNAIYVRVEAEAQGNFLTNDNDTSTRIAFDELGSGDVITVTTPVVLE